MIPEKKNTAADDDDSNLLIFHFFWTVSSRILLEDESKKKMSTGKELLRDAPAKLCSSFVSICRCELEQCRSRLFCDFTVKQLLYF